MIKVLLVDDHDLVRTGIRRLLEDRASDRGIKVIAEAASGEEAIDKVKAEKPDVVLMDVNMPGIGGLEATRRMLQVNPGLKLIVLTVHADGPLPRRLLQAGAKGYLTKGCAADEMVAAIEKVHRGERYIAAEIAQYLALAMLPGGQESPFDLLSEREMQILMMITEGQRVQAISKKLCISPKTVSTYKSRLYEKLDVGSDVELIRLALQHGMLEQHSVQ